MGEYDEICVETFLRKQSQLFGEPVAENLDEAEAFLDDCMAVVADSAREVRKYFEESGADTAGLSDDELLEAAEVFDLEDGRYLVVEA